MSNDIVINKQSKYLHDNHFKLWIAMRHHRTHKGEKLDFKYHSYQMNLLLDEDKDITVIKSTQCGISELLIIRAIANAISGRSIFYVLPTYSLVNRFVRNRIDKSFANTVYYNGLERLTKEDDVAKRSESMTLKDIGLGTIAFVGSNSTAAFTEFPADEVIIDELDECDQDNIIMAEERLSHSAYQNKIQISNPTIEGYGIDAKYAETDQKEWHIKHECGNYVRLDWFKHIVQEVEQNTYIIRDKDFDWTSGKDLRPICDKCHKPIANRKQEGSWIAKKKSDKSGYRITKLFSGNVTLEQLVLRFNDGLANDSIMQRFYNADLGEAYTSAGAKITEKMLNGCVLDHLNGCEVDNNAICIMGIDVGSVLHCTIGQILPDGKIRVIMVCELPVSQEAIQEMIKKYNVRITVIDAMPERYFVSKIKNRCKNVFSCFYGGSKKEPIDSSLNVTVDRTSSLDALKESIVSKLILLPVNARDVPEFYNHMTASTRIFDKDKNMGTGAYIWTEGSKADHYFHSLNYMLIAKKLLIMLKE